jgi:phage terminase large subunit-like protein
MSLSLLERAAASVGIKGILAAIPPEAHAQLPYDWRCWARPEQLQPGELGASSERDDWDVWLLLAGRGFGKTRVGAEWVRKLAQERPGCRIALIGRTAADVRTTMLEGPSGLLEISPPDFRPYHEPSKCKVIWPNGSIALHFSAEEPRGLRGPQFDAAWCDELAAWSTHKDEDGEPGIPPAWTQLQFGMRLPGSHPRVLATTTPKPTPIIRALIKDQRTVVVRGSTFDNEKNLAPEFIARIKNAYDGTRIGRQELYAEVLEGVEGALWRYEYFDAGRLRFSPALRRVVVAVDPSGSAKKTADEAGIVVAGIGECDCKVKHKADKPELHAFVLEDLTGKYSPRDMGLKAVDAYHRHQASRLVAEDNFGGKIIEDLVTLIDKRVAYKAVHATRGKLVRAEPVAALYEQGKVHHVGSFAALEDECCNYAPLVSTESPGRMDALVWAITDLMLGECAASFGALPFKPAGRIFGGDPSQPEERPIERKSGGSFSLWDGVADD